MLPEKWKEWKVVEEIGRGSYGCVYRIQKDDAVMAVKVIDIPQENERNLIMKEHGANAEAYCQSIAQDFETEIHTLTLLGDSENIIHIADYQVEKKKEIGWTIYLFMDCLTSFPEYAISHKMDESECIRLASEIGGALAECQKKGVIHRDIKPENILVTDEGKFHLCDFGLARKLRYKEQISSVKGTYKYMAPEVYHGKDYNASIDIYSLGLILYQYMNRGRGPFLSLDKQIIFFKDEEAALGRRMDGETIPSPTDASPEFASIIQKMIAFTPQDRYKNAEMLLKDLALLRKGKYKIRKKEDLYRRYKKYLLVSCLVLIAAIACAAWYRSPVWEGEECGPACSSRLNHGGTLTIYGTGAVEYPDSWEYRKDQIKRIVIEEGITAIGGNGGLFEGCNNLVSLRCPESLQRIEEYSFYNCINLKDVFLDAAAKQYGCNAFQGTPWFEANTDENGFLVYNGVLVSFSGKAEEPVIPDTVREIADFAFHDHDEIRKVILPAPIEYVGENAFSDCDNLKTVKAENPDIVIGADAFAYTKWIEKGEWITLNRNLIRYNGQDEEPVFPGNIDTVGPQAFADNAYLKKVVIPEWVKKLGENAFAYSSQLESVKIKGPVQTIPASAFEGCASLKECILPDTIKEICPEAFTSCVRLKKIRIPETAKLLQEDGKDPFYQCDHIKIDYY